MRSARSAILAVLSCVVAIACEVGGPSARYVIPGPTSPTAVTSGPPFVWQSSDQLETWRSHPASRGPLTIGDEGPISFIRVTQTTSAWVLRGPDLSPPATSVRTVRLRYRWQPDPNLDRNASRNGHVSARFERDPAAADQPIAHANIQPASDWTEMEFVPGDFAPPLNVRYVYLHSFGFNRGVFEIARIELVP